MPHILFMIALDSAEVLFQTRKETDFVPPVGTRIMLGDMRCGTVTSVLYQLSRDYWEVMIEPDDPAYDHTSEGKNAAGWKDMRPPWRKPGG